MEKIKYPPPTRVKTFWKRVICCRKAKLLYSKEKEEERKEEGVACGSKDLITIILKNDGETP